MTTTTTPRPPTRRRPRTSRSLAKLRVHDFWTVAGRAIRGVFREPEFFIPALIVPCSSTS
jgi:hypothetical protein